MPLNAPHPVHSEPKPLPCLRAVPPPGCTAPCAGMSGDHPYSLFQPARSSHPSICSAALVPAQSHTQVSRATRVTHATQRATAPPGQSRIAAQTEPHSIPLRAIAWTPAHTRSLTPSYSGPRLPMPPALRGPCAISLDSTRVQHSAASGLGSLPPPLFLWARGGSPAQPATWIYLARYTRAPRRGRPAQHSARGAPLTPPRLRSHPASSAGGAACAVTPGGHAWKRPLLRRTSSVDAARCLRHPSGTAACLRFVTKGSPQVPQRSAAPAGRRRRTCPAGAPPGCPPRPVPSRVCNSLRRPLCAAPRACRRGAADSAMRYARLRALTGCSQRVLACRLREGRRQCAPLSSITPSTQKYEAQMAQLGRFICASIFRAR